jgi:hypothetical protein
MKSACLFEAAASLLDDYAAAFSGFVIIAPSKIIPQPRNEKLSRR